MPLNRLHVDVLRVLAAERNADSYVAGGVAINREGPRFSAYIDIFQDNEQRLESAAQADAKSLISAGFRLAWKKIVAGRREAEVESLGETMRLEWVLDSAFRFFPAQPDELFGYVLHPADLAANKASAAANRREPRDIFDLLTVHESILPLGAVICAAVGRFPGQSPEEMLADIRRNSRFTVEDFRVLATERFIDVPDLHRRIRGMLDEAEAFIGGIPSDAVGCLFLERGKPVQPDLAELGKYQRHVGNLGGIWPSSREISAAMLEHYNKRDEQQ